MAKKRGDLAGASLRAIMTFALGAGAALTASPAAAQDQEEEVVVTGSYIIGTPEDAALPVTVITAEDLLNRGAPTTLDLIKTLPESSGVLGDTNQFDARAQGSEGSGTVNLRGLGPQRTLVLLNGHRMVLNPFALIAAGAVDTNTIPAFAIARVEVLKDGAAATYGSDAIGGVVNFITRDDLDGFEVGGDYEFIDGSDGDYSAHALWGWTGERAQLLLSAGVQHRSELAVLERDWAHLPYLSNPQGGWSAAGSPSSYISLVGLPANPRAFRDPGCTPLGGEAFPSTTTPVCYWQYNIFDNLTETEDRYQFFASFDVDLTDSMQFHSDALIAHTEVPEWQTSPSYALLQGPTAGAGSGNSPVPNRFYLPATNPGLAYFIAQNPGGVGGTVLLTGGPTTITAAEMGLGLLNVGNRPYALGGNPLFDYGPSYAEREYDAVRLSAGLSGSWGDAFDWDLTVGYGEEVAYRTGRDTVVTRYQRLLKGLGGPACPTVGGTPGVGNCYFIDPFNYQIPGNAITGVANPTFQPAGYNPGGLNIGNHDPDIINWFFPVVWTRDTASLTTVDLVLNGDTPINLAGGPVRWAAGGQFRQEGYQRELDDLSNIALNPCINSPDFNNDICAATTGALGFLGSSSESSLSRDIYAAFGELSIPFSDALQVQIAARFEDYRSGTGSTFDPKISARYQATDWLAFRASAGSTFRGPSLPSVAPSNVTALQDVRGTFRAIDIFGNPDLEPESAGTLNVGAIVETSNFFFTVDWWRFDFENPLITEPLGGMVDALFGSSGTANCGVPAYAALEARFTFSTTCSAANVTRVLTFNVNGAPIETSGIDVQAQLDFDVMGGTLAIGGNASYILEYVVGAQDVEGITVQPAFDAVGLLNYQTSVYPLPQWKGSAYIEWGNASQNLRFTVNHIDSYTDQRTTIFAPSPNWGGATISAGKEIDAQTTLDLNYRLDLGDHTTVLAGVQNLTNEDPAFARLDLNYDPFTGDAIGRTIRVGLRQRF
jgi:iron complex outermembrane receptor protein